MLRRQGFTLMEIIVVLIIIGVVVAFGSLISIHPMNGPRH